MKNIRKLALAALMLTSISTLCMQGNDESTYKAIAEWMYKVDWYKKLQIAAAVKKVKEIDLSKVLEKLKALYEKK